jgi:DNA-binding transcriptional MerR regulator
MVITRRQMPDKRQTTAADPALTIDALAERVGMTVRNLREWRTLGLLPRAEMRGRVGYYSPEVVDRVEQIKKLHSEGFPLELISRILDAGGGAGDEVMRLAETLRAPFREDPPTAGERRTQERIAEIANSLQDLGLSVDRFLDATAHIRGDLEKVAETFEQVWLDTIWEPFVAAGMPESELPRIQETAAMVKPLALETVVALFKSAMDAQIEGGIARELARQEARRAGEETG